MIPPFNGNIFQRIYRDVLEIKDDLQKKEHEGHEWIDFDKQRQINLHNDQWIVVDDIENTKKQENK